MNSETTNSAPEKAAEDQLAPAIKTTWQDEKAPLSAPVSPPEAIEGEALSNEVTSPWLLFLTETKYTQKEIKALFSSLKKSGAIISPRDQVKSRFAELLREDPSRFARVLSLLADSRKNQKKDKRDGQGIRRACVDAAEVAVRCFVDLPPAENAENFHDDVSAWLRGAMAKKPATKKGKPINEAIKQVKKISPPTTFQLLLALIHIGEQRCYFDEEKIFRLLERFLAQAKSRTKGLPALELLLTAAPNSNALPALCLAREQEHVKKLREECEANREEIEWNRGEVADLQQNIKSLHDQLAQLSQEKDNADSEIIRLKQEKNEISDSAILKLDRLRGRQADVKQKAGQHVRKALESAQSRKAPDKLWIESICERLEDALTILREENQ